MPFMRVNEQCAEHTDGYKIGLDTDHATYSEPRAGRQALVAADLFETKRLRLLEDRVSGWFVGPEIRSMTKDEERMVVGRVEAAFRFLGVTVQRESG